MRARLKGDISQGIAIEHQMDLMQSQFTVSCRYATKSELDSEHRFRAIDIL